MDDQEYKEDVWSDFEFDFLTNGTGYAHIATYKACREAFDAAWNGSRDAAYEAAKAVLPDQLKFTKEHISMIQSNNYELDDHVRTIFKIYCDIFDIHMAYGVEKWEEYNNYLSITQDVSARSCYNSTDHNLPLEWLYIEDETALTQAIQAAFDKKKEAERQELEAKKLASQKRQEEKDRAEFLRLKEKFGEQ